MGTVVTIGGVQPPRTGTVGGGQWGDLDVVEWCSLYRTVAIGLPHFE